MSEVDSRIAQLEAQLQTLKAEVAADRNDDLTTRRAMFKKLALGAAGVAAVGLATSEPAAALDGDFIKLGTEGAPNASTSATRADHTGAAAIKMGFVFQDGSSFAATNSNYPAALGGWATVTGTSAKNGVYGYTQWDDHAGVVGYGSLAVPGSIGGRFTGARADLNLVSNGAAASVVTVAHKVGDVVRTDDGDLWYVAADGTPGTLRKLAGVATAGQLHLLTTPQRVYDGRSAAKLAASSTTTVPLTLAIDGTTPALPAGANGALLTITAVGPTNSGYLTAYNNSLGTAPGTSTLNFTALQDIATTTVVSCDAAGRIKITIGPGTSVYALVDVIGYYL
jgi:hypothetical protein